MTVISNDVCVIKLELSIYFLVYFIDVFFSTVLIRKFKQESIYKLFFGVKIRESAKIHISLMIDNERTLWITFMKILKGRIKLYIINFIC